MLPCARRIRLVHAKYRQKREPSDLLMRLPQKGGAHGAESIFAIQIVDDAKHYYASERPAPASNLDTNNNRLWSRANRSLGRSIGIRSRCPDWACDLAKSKATRDFRPDFRETSARCSFFFCVHRSISGSWSLSAFGCGFNRSRQHLLILPDEEVCIWRGMHGIGPGLSHNLGRGQPVARTLRVGATELLYDSDSVR